MKNNNKFKNLQVSYDMEISTVGVNSIVIGNRPHDDICITESQSKSFAVTINRINDGFEVTCDDEEIPVFINGTLVQKENSFFAPGTFLSIDGIPFYFEEHAIKTSMSFKLKTTFNFKDLSESGKAMVYPEFYRNVRYLYELPEHLHIYK